MTMIGVNYGELFVNEDDGCDGDRDEDVDDSDNDIYLTDMTMFRSSQMKNMYV